MDPLDRIDVERLRLTPPAGANGVPPKRPRRPRHAPGELFLRGPIPLAWLARAANLRGKGLAVALALWFQAGMRRNDSRVTLTAKVCDRFCVGRKASYRGLAALERVGLVAVERHVGRAPVVTLLPVDAPRE